MVDRSLSGQVAIVGLGRTEYVRESSRKTKGRLAIEACQVALRDASLSPSDIDGLCGNPFQASPQHVAEGLGVPSMVWWCTSGSPFSLMLTEALNAVNSGACTTALVYQALHRTISTSKTAGEGDPIRSLPDPWREMDHHGHETYFVPYGNRHVTYPGYMRRYMYEFNVPREDFGLIALNGRTNAAQNPDATFRKPLTMADYLSGRMIRDPMSILDMDFPLDGGDAVVVTTAERARDISDHPVYVEAVSYGSQGNPEVDLFRNLRSVGQTVAVRKLFEKSSLSLADMDVLFPYDGFSIIALRWLESFGFCDIGEGGPFVRDHWDESTNRFLLNGRVPMNPHGGALSEGASLGAGHLREAVLQLQGRAGPRQVDQANAALIAIGGLFWNSTALILRR